MPLPRYQGPWADCIHQELVVCAKGNYIDERDDVCTVQTINSR